MTFAQYELRMQTTIITQVKEIYTRIQKKLRIYFILTLVCIACDLIGFIIQLVRFAEMAGDERADAMLIGACYIFLIVDFYYACWVKSVNMNLPPKLRESSTSALMGFGNKFKRELNIGALKARDMVKKGGKAILCISGFIPVPSCFPKHCLVLSYPHRTVPAPFGQE